MSTDNTFDVGPAPAPPAWCAPETQPTWDTLTVDGGTVASWTRDIGDRVWIAADDTIEAGRWVRSLAVIGFCEPSGRGLDPAEARSLAAELIHAADVLDFEL